MKARLGIQFLEACGTDRSKARAHLVDMSVKPARSMLKHDF